MTYNDSIRTPGGMIKGCAYCAEKHGCPDAFTDKSSGCGAFDTALMHTNQKGGHNGQGQDRKDPAGASRD